MRILDLNCDMGELKPGQTRNYDAEIMPYISSCNIACGFHSGDPLLMEQTLKSAIQHEVKIGAHPSYHDRKNFGRVSLKVDRPQLLAQIRYQIAAVKGMAESFGQSLHHVKAHGALYNDMAKDPELALDFVALVKSMDPNLRIFGLAHSALTEACSTLNMACLNEAFADRRYEQRTQLRSRTFDDAVIHAPNQILHQIDGFLAGEVQLVDGSVCQLQVDTLCLHSDTPGAVELSKLIHDHLIQCHVEIV